MRGANLGIKSLIIKLFFKQESKFGFTLAEVLITLGIIGVVAAMTMPALIVNYQKQVAATRLEKFYTVMMQAVMRWENEEGIIPGNFVFDDSVVKNGENTKKWFDSTIGKYIQQDSIENKSSQIYLNSKFNDGSGFVAYVASNNTMYFFYCVEYKYCKLENYDGRHTFLFSLANGKFIPSTSSQISKTRAQLLNECKNPLNGSKSARHACTMLIQVDGWKIAKDYPW